MTEISINGDVLAVEPQGLDKLWSFKNRLSIPLEHVTNVRLADGECGGGIRAPGTSIPGLVRSGTFYQDGKRVFWNVHNPRNAIALDLRDDLFASVVVEVSDPSRTITDIRAALAPRRV